MLEESSNQRSYSTCLHTTVGGRDASHTNTRTLIRFYEELAISAVSEDGLHHPGEGYVSRPKENNVPAL